VLAEPKRLEQGKGINMLLFGFPGVGKTPLLGSSELRTLIIRPPADHTASIRSPHNCREMVAADWAGMYEAKRYAQQKGWKEFDWVWLDSLSVFQDFGLRDVLGDAIARKPSRAVEKGGTTIAEHGADQGEYGINFSRITGWVQDMVGFADEGKFNFGITCHPEVWFNPKTEDSVLAPWIQGKGMIPKICGYMNIIAYLEEVQRDGKDPYLKLVSQAEGFYGKDQFHAFPKLKSGSRGIVNPTMSKIMDAVEAVREEPSDEDEREAERPKRKRKIKKPKKG
jgi:hypothetical protein